MNEAASIGIIGGADGPTAVFVVGRFPWEIVLLAAAGIVLFVYLLKKKK